MPEPTLPTFLIVGAAKAGTTSLAAYLRPHPDLFLVPEKELRFFDQNVELGLDWYASHFDRAAEIAVRGEATPNYMYDGAAVARMSETLPDASLIAILRDPVDRLYSHYWHLRTRSSESRSLLDAVAERPEYADRGRYLPQLQRLVEHYPREQLLVLFFEDLVADPARIVAETFSFLGVDPAFRPGNLGKVYNRAATVRAPGFRREMLRRRAWGRWPRVAAWVDARNRKPVDYPPMTAEERATLAELFRTDNAELARWLGRELPGWSA